MAGQRSGSAKPKRYNVFVTLGGPQFDGVPLPTKGGNPLPLERATQTGHGTWQYLAGPNVENVTRQYLERLLGVNGRGPLLVRLNKDLGGSPPILVAAETGKEPLVNFLLVHFREDLTLPRTEDTNLLNTCIERCSMELAISVAQVYPEFLRKLPGGTSDKTPPAIACVRANKTLSRFLIRFRDPGFDRLLVEGVTTRMQIYSLWLLLDDIATHSPQWLRNTLILARAILWTAPIISYCSHVRARINRWRALCAVCTIFGDDERFASRSKESFAWNFAARSLFEQVFSGLHGAPLSWKNDIWQGPLRREAKRMPNQSRITTASVHQFASALSVDLKKPTEGLFGEQAFLVPELAHIRKLTLLPPSKRTDYDKRVRWRVALAKFSADVAAGGSAISVRKSAGTDRLPSMPAEIWHIIFDILCTHRS